VNPRSFVVILLCSLGCVSCQSEPAAGDESGAAAAKDAAPQPEAQDAAGAEAEPAAAETSSTGGTESTGGPEVDAPPVDLSALPSVGVEFCDAYVAKYRTCIESKIPEAERPAHAAKLADEVSHWERTAKGAGEGAAKALEIGCKSAQASAARSTRDHDCEW
jgi:hypothetical protein